MKRRRREYLIPGKVLNVDLWWQGSGRSLLLRWKIWMISMINIRDGGVE